MLNIWSLNGLSPMTETFENSLQITKFVKIGTRNVKINYRRQRLGWKPCKNKMNHLKNKIENYFQFGRPNFSEHSNNDMFKKKRTFEDPIKRIWCFILSTKNWQTWKWRIFPLKNFFGKLTDSEIHSNIWSNVKSVEEVFGQLLNFFHVMDVQWKWCVSNVQRIIWQLM